MLSSVILRIKDTLKSWPFYFLPHHFLSRIIFAGTRIKGKFCQPFIRWFVRHFNVNMQEALHENIQAYQSFNEFFTRELKPDARTINHNSDIFVSPVDGTVSQIGKIERGKIFQAKRYSFTTHELLGKIPEYTKLFEGGHFATLYLSPRDYHRIHMPYKAWLKEMIYIPGRLFSVAPHTTRAIPNLFARNERVVAIFNSDIGIFAMVLVGAINVAAIETVWHGMVTPPHKRSINRFKYPEFEIELEKGQEMGRFNMGSTVILLTGANTQWSERLTAESAVQLGQAIAQIH